MGETIFSSPFFFNISEISTNIKKPTKCSEYVMLKFTKQPKTPGITSKKNMAFPPEGNKLFAGDFRANLDETNADMVQFPKRGNWKWIV